MRPLEPQRRMGCGDDDPSVARNLPARDEEVRALASSRAAIARLWDVCQIPDYRKISPAAHAELVATLYGFLLREGRISDDWFAHQIAQADHAVGIISGLAAKQESAPRLWYHHGSAVF